MGTAPLVIYPAATRIMLALLCVHARDGRATVRTVATEAGRGTAITHRHLCLLRAEGLVAWEDGINGSLRPLARPVTRAA